jgi:hypothetical protein
MHQTSCGDTYLVALPEFLKPTGLHFSFHASGECHIRTVKPRLNADLPNINELATHFQRQAIPALETIIRPPKQGYPALIMILPHPERFVMKSFGNRYIMDFAGAFDASIIASIDDTANLAPALQQLKTNGYINGNAVVMITTESGEISTYYSSDIAGKLNHVPSSGWLREVARFQGIIATFDNQRGQLPKFMQVAFKPLFKPIQELMDAFFALNIPIGQSTKIKSFEHVIENLSTHIEKKELIRID